MKFYILLKHKRNANDAKEPLWFIYLKFLLECNVNNGKGAITRHVIVMLKSAQCVPPDFPRIITAPVTSQ